MVDTELPTPDFYRYPWATPDSARLDRRFVEIGWADGARLRAFDLWLVENSLGHGIDPLTREGIIDPADLPDGPAVAEAGLDGDGALVVTWRADGSRTRFHPGWLRHVADGDHRPAAPLPRPEPWLAADLGQPPTRDGAGILTDDDLLEAWLTDLVRHGLARLTGLGTDLDLVPRLGARIGATRDTNFGPDWDVKAAVAPNSTANTNRRLCPHTDLPTRETPPGFQFLHCITNTTAGGWSTMTDGLALVEHLAAEAPEHLDALTTLDWIFVNRGPTVDHRWSGPLIELGDGHRPTTFRAFHPVRGFPDMAEADVPRAYAALRHLARLAIDPRFQLRYPFAPGDLVAFDNRRILHGRDCYGIGDGRAIGGIGDGRAIGGIGDGRAIGGIGDEPDGGHRHLRGVYLDRDEVLSRLRVVRRRRTLVG